MSAGCDPGSDMARLLLEGLERDPRCCITFGTAYGCCGVRSSTLDRCGGLREGEDSSSTIKYPGCPEGPWKKVPRLKPTLVSVAFVVVVGIGADTGVTGSMMGRTSAMVLPGPK
jgi:hypothetical protein